MIFFQPMCFIFDWCNHACLYSTLSVTNLLQFILDNNSLVKNCC